MTDQELRQSQWDAAQRYISGTRDHFLVVDWKSVWYYSNLFSPTKKEATK
jgi:hypothetical protein